MRFLMFVCNDTAPVEHPGPDRDVEEWVEDLDAKGIRITGDPLVPESEAKVVRARGDEVLVTDGPFLETKEILAGFDLLECADIDEAVQVAARHPMASHGVIELRAIREF